MVNLNSNIENGKEGICVPAPLGEKSLYKNSPLTLPLINECAVYMKAYER